MGWADMADRMLGVAVRTFSDTDADGETRVEYLPKGGSPIPLSAVFDAAHLSVDPSTGAPVSSTNPILGIRNSDLPSPPQQGDRVTVRGILYHVLDAQPDGVAGSLLELQKA